MDEYIKREDAICEIEQINPVDYGAMWDYEAHHWAGECLRDCKEAIDSIPAADVSPVVHATWVLTSDFGPSEFYHCSRCGREEVRFGKSSIYQQYPYCHCGAKMDGGDNDAST